MPKSIRSRWEALLPFSEEWAVSIVIWCTLRFVVYIDNPFRFKNLWIQFTRKGNDFTVKKCSAVCEDHFADERVVVKKKGRLYLIKKTVPTIYFREAKEGLEKVTVEFDPVDCQYVGQESVNLLRGTVSAQEEKALIDERRNRVLELKSLCRFCFESQDDKFVAITRLESYSIDPNEMLTLVGIGPQYNEVFSEIVCEQCFQQIVSIDGYRKRCRKAQDELVAEMQELDQRLQVIRNLKTEERPWFKYEPIPEEEQQQTSIEIIEEHLDDNISYVGDEEDDFHAEEYDTHGFVTYKMEVPDETKEFRQIIVKEEIEKYEPMDDIIEQTDPDFDEEFEEADEDDDDDFSLLPEQSEKDVYTVTDNDAIIKNPERNTFALRIYQCFFCRLKFAGKKTFKAHDCQVKEVKCEFDSCDKYFNKLSGYNTHVVKVHGLLKTSKHFCPICKNVVMSTDNQFKLHCRQCNKDSEKKNSDNPIECEICKKRCPNLKSYTVHKLFHDTRNLVGAGEKGISGMFAKGPVICEVSQFKIKLKSRIRKIRKFRIRIGFAIEFLI